VLYGTGGWLSKYGGAVEFVAKDSGIGVSGTKLEYETSPAKWEQLSAHNYLEVENSCQGVQCYQEHREDWTLDPKLPNGEDKIRYKAEEAMAGTQSTESEGQTTLKVDAARPHSVLLNGLPWGNELSERAYELTAEATDGEGPTIASSGVKSIAFFVDGHEFGTAGGSCAVPVGECTATSKWTINGAELGAGHHAIVLVVLDNAGNETRREETLSIRHSTPVAFGPGSVDLQSGDFTLGATDVSMGSGLTLQRNYSSRDLTGGENGPLGPQWSFSMGSTESLVEMVDGGILMTAANGSQTIFAALGEGKFEAPPGDSNLTLTLEENPEKTHKLAYYLKNAAASTSVKFTLPLGSMAWLPTKQEGTAATDTVTYAYKTEDRADETVSATEYPAGATAGPSGITEGPDGNLWYADALGAKIAKITTAGVTTQYALPSGSEPFGVVSGPDGKLWYAVSNTNKIDKVTTSGSITEYALPSGSGPISITVGPDGNLWYTDNASSKIGKITTSGTITEYALPAGSNPFGISEGPDGKLWFTSSGTNKIGKITTSGAITEYALPAGAAPHGITKGTDGNMWFTDYGTNKIGTITTAGSITEYALAAGSQPIGITQAVDGNMWFASSGTNKIGEITLAGAVTEYAVASGTGPFGVVQGASRNLWYTEFFGNKVGKINVPKTLTKPVEALAPVPAKVSCEPEMKAGCRDLKFTYATKTTASGEAESGWGEYNQRLMKVALYAYNPAPAVKKMQETTVAEYRYDNLGRLRAEWDPRISPALKTIYGYDEEGHVTALASPGQEPWAFTYGAQAGDAGTGRLIKLNRAPASAELFKAEAPTNTESPKITGTIAEGVKIAVSLGKWSGSPVAYGYQWNDCNTSGAECKPIVGATNGNYTLKSSDVGHTIVAKILATNSGGSTTAQSSASVTVQSIVAAQVSEFALPAGSAPFGITAGPDGNVWFTDTSTGKAGKITSTGTVTEYATEKDEPEGITTGPDGNLWFVEHSIRHVNHMTTSGALTVYTLTRTGTYNVGIATGPDGNLWFTESESGYIAKITTKNEVLGEYALPAGSKPYGIVVGPDKNLWFTEYGTNKIGKITTSGTITEYALPTGSHPYNITAGSDGNLWFSDYGSSKIGKITIGGTITEYALASGSEPRGITSGPEGNLWFTDYGSSKIGKITTTGTITEYALASGSKPNAITTGPDGNMWFANYGTSKIGKISLAGAETQPVQPGMTIDYQVPLQGSSAPAQMGINETTHKPEPEKWGQTEDLPVEATAIFPTDSPQGWPATGYKRATGYYLDERGRTVNVAAPSTSSYGSIATTEYNEFNDVTRTLSPDNRATALAAGSKSSEVSKLLDTENTYNGEGSKEKEVSEPGTRLIETLGPQHEIKYMAGKEQKESLARNHTKYFYDEGAKEVEEKTHETYSLVTKTTNLAQLANEEEVEVRKTVTSYSGQNNLGWKLRAPTSVTVDPEGMKLTSTTEYNETTGQVKETRGAAAANTFTFTSKFGEVGTEPGKLKTPWGVAVDSAGNLWVADTGNNRIEKFDAEGKYLSKFGETGSEPGKLSGPEGIAIDSKGNIWVADSGNNRIEEFGPEGKYLLTVGSAGTEPGKFKAPAAIAFDSKSNMWVADTGNSRVEKFDTEHKYVSEFGSPGTEPGKLAEPKGIAIDAEGHVWVSDTGNNRIQEFSTTGTLIRQVGSSGPGEGRLNSPQSIGFDSTGNLWVVDGLNSRAESFTASGAYASQIGWKGTEQGQLSEPRAIAIDSHGNLWVSDSTNNRVEQWSKGANAHDAKLIYYTSDANTEGYTACGGHPEWAGLLCETLPAKQPELAGLPKLPITTVLAYNMWNEPEKTEEKFGEGSGAKTRTKITTYDAAGRRETSETTSTATEDTALPKVTFVYNKETGILEKRSTTEGTITSEYDRLGKLAKYTDASGKQTKYKYAGLENDGLLEEVTDSSNEGHAYQAYTYDETTKLLTHLVDSGVGTFTASYDAEGKLSSEIYPNSMCANYTYNSVGESTNVEYLKTANCSEPEPALWYSDTRVPSVRGETFSQISTFANESYAYDTLGRLTETQETPAGEGCTTRSYTYDEESNRASSTTRNPNSKGECVTEGGTVETHNYDEANRFTDNEITYDPLGNIAKLPAADAEGHELKTTFYVDNAVATQEQNEERNVYTLDPEGRVTQTVSTGKTASSVKSYYDSAGDAVAWTEEVESKKWTRNIPSLDGTMAAIEVEGATAILQLHDLQGNIVATIKDKVGETELLSKYNSTEFGVPNHGKEAPKFAWLGAGGIASSLPSGVITYGATSYVPQTGRILQSEEVEPPGVPGGTGAGARYTSQEEPWNMQGAAREATEAPGLEAGREREAAEAACRANPASCITVEDPHWIWMVTVRQAEQIAGTIIGSEGYLTATKIGDLLKKIAGIDFIAQLEEAVEEGVFGFSRDELEKWALGLAEGLGECASDALFGYRHPKDPHCWVYVVTNRYRIGFTIFGQFIGYTFSIPNFKKDTEIKYCPIGEHNCYTT
jgi:streptogramin lyase